MEKYILSIDQGTTSTRATSTRTPGSGQRATSGVDRLREQQEHK